jgi:hypothetical protein
MVSAPEGGAQRGRRHLRSTLPLDSSRSCAHQHKNHPSSALFGIVDETSPFEGAENFTTLQRVIKRLIRSVPRGTHAMHAEVAPRSV